MGTRAGNTVTSGAPSMSRACATSLIRNPLSQAELDVLAAHRRDALAQDVPLLDPAAEGDAGEEPDLLRGIPAADVERRIRFREPLLLRLGQRLGEGKLVLAHAGEDVIGRAVDDADDARHPVAHEAFPAGP